MADILIHPHNVRGVVKATIDGETVLGVKWLKANMDVQGTPCLPLVVDGDGVEDIVKLIEQEGLSVEVR